MVVRINTLINTILFPITDIYFNIYEPCYPSYQINSATIKDDKHARKTFFKKRGSYPAY
jgi:hypothetical protein